MILSRITYPFEQLLTHEIPVEVCEADRLSVDRLADDLLEVPGGPGGREVDLPVLLDAVADLVDDGARHVRVRGERRVCEQRGEIPSKEERKKRKHIYIYFIVPSALLLKRNTMDFKFWSIAQTLQ